MPDADSAAAAEDSAARLAALQRIGEKSRAVVELWLGAGAGRGGPPVSPELANDFVALGQRLLANPVAMVETQAEFWQDYLTLWQRTTQRLLGQEAAPVIEPARDD